MRGDQKKKIREIKFENYRRCKFGPHYLLAQGYIVASINWRSASMPIFSSSADLFHFPWRQQFAAFCLFVRTLPIDFALLGRKRKYIKIKTTAKLKAKRTSIATIWYLCQTYATFPTPLGSHYRLPLKGDLSNDIILNPPLFPLVNTFNMDSATKNLEAR
jgi:hypothetical protein